MNGSSQYANRHPLLRKIESIALFALSAEECAALEALPMQAALIDADQDIVREGDRPGRSFAVISGIASTYKTTRAGKRQVMSYHVPGDVPDFQSLHLQTLDISIAAVTPCSIGYVQHDAVRALFRAQPRLTEVFWRATLIDAAIVREWTLNTGRRDAYARMAHLLCELVTRLEAVGLAPDLSCDLPMTQPELADALGITPVHVNRTIRDLKAAGLLTLRNRHLTVHDWDGLVAAAEFDPTYLHLRQEA
ncbi:Crp/Fnr family transcriptional regulator [Methylobacterium sp. SI9]|uniref:Crp/Fnr family transcriptional regulator n=1 Tax=Methylobacterium guangdongense TaxID=3138811 RepID=UPI00313EE7AB